MEAVLPPIEKTQTEQVEDQIIAADYEHLKSIRIDLVLSAQSVSELTSMGYTVQCAASYTIISWTQTRQQKMRFETITSIILWIEAFLIIFCVLCVCAIIAWQMFKFYQWNL